MLSGRTTLFFVSLFRTSSWLIKHFQLPPRIATRSPTLIVNQTQKRGLLVCASNNFKVWPPGYAAWNKVSSFLHNSIGCESISSLKGFLTKEIVSFIWLMSIELFLEGREITHAHRVIGVFLFIFSYVISLNLTFKSCTKANIEFISGCNVQDLSKA